MDPTLASAQDPVCHMNVDPAQPKGGTFEHDGQLYGFCNPKCREKFRADPARYLDPSHGAAHGAPAAPGPPAAPAPPGTTYVCPMDPEVREPGPAACRICGMALEPE